jgi:hypothetical protein
MFSARSARREVIAQLSARQSKRLRRRQYCRSESAASHVLAIATMALKHHDWFSSNFVANRTAGIAAGERYFHSRHNVSSREEVYSLDGNGGYCSNLGIAGSIWSHGCASETKISICGLNKPGSSRLPARTPTNGDSPPSNSAPVIRDPHSGQKPRLCFPRLMLFVKL